ncbi:hypothetical protein Ptr902_09959 [Pyrenophora tritici-repentis]|nr:hypothetical protein A1F99_104210 [Pyrenophora tritici-repentis]KAI2478346.1 hypothetical protein Ptr902_09959 [Pyrenophora tritici-repentis]
MPAVVMQQMTPAAPLSGSPPQYYDVCKVCKTMFARKNTK